MGAGRLAGRRMLQILRASAIKPGCSKICILKVGPGRSDFPLVIWFSSSCGVWRLQTAKLATFKAIGFCPSPYFVNGLVGKDQSTTVHPRGSLPLIFSFNVTMVLVGAFGPVKFGLTYVNKHLAADMASVCSDDDESQKPDR